MGETDEPTETPNENIAPLSHLRILVIMAIVAAAGSAFGFWFFSLKTGFGVLAGGALSFANYYWMKHSLKTVFEQSKNEEKPRFIGSSYVLRYFVFGTLLAVLYLISVDLVVPVILGLSSFAVAIMLEGFIRLFGSLGR